MIKKPLLSHHLDVEAGELERLRFPLWGTPKIDGIRMLKVDGHAVSRTFKRVPNRYTRELVERGHIPNGLDGEFIVLGDHFHDTNGAFRSESGTPNFRWKVFDYISDSDSSAAAAAKPYLDRLDDLAALSLPLWIERLLPVPIHTMEQLGSYEEQFLSMGWEGIMLRRGDGPYKFGRSTFNEHILMALKRFADAEAMVVGYEEQVTNQNEPMRDAFGHTKRSSHKANLVTTGRLGALICVGIGDPFEGVQFNIGTGFDSATRERLWDDRDRLRGQVVKYRYQQVGVKDCPRIPSFLGFRAPEDVM